MKTRTLLGLCLLMSLMSGCASMEPATAETGVTHETCLVCKMNYDLACIDVAVDSKTPTYMYNGTTYYFCSDDCRDKFERAPQKYLGK